MEEVTAAIIFASSGDEEGIGGMQDGDLGGDVHLLCMMEGGRREDVAAIFCMHSCN